MGQPEHNADDGHQRQPDEYPSALHPRILTGRAGGGNGEAGEAPDHVSAMILPVGQNLARTFYRLKKHTAPDAVNRVASYRQNWPAYNAAQSA